jgi:hypothetical protein
MFAEDVQELFAQFGRGLGRTPRVGLRAVDTESRKCRGLAWKFDTITFLNPCAASERPRSSITAMIVEARKWIDPGCGTGSDAT